MEVIRFSRCLLFLIVIFFSSWKLSAQSHHRIEVPATKGLKALNYALYNDGSFSLFSENGKGIFLNGFNNLGKETHSGALIQENGADLSRRQKDILNCILFGEKAPILKPYHINRIILADYVVDKDRNAIRCVYSDDNHLHVMSIDAYGKVMDSVLDIAKMKMWYDETEVKFTAGSLTLIEKQKSENTLLKFEWDFARSKLVSSGTTLPEEIDRKEQYLFLGRVGEEDYYTNSRFSVKGSTEPSAITIYVEKNSLMQPFVSFIPESPDGDLIYEIGRIEIGASGRNLYFTLNKKRAFGQKEDEEENPSIGSFEEMKEDQDKMQHGYQIFSLSTDTKEWTSYTYWLPQRYRTSYYFGSFYAEENSEDELNCVLGYSGKSVLFSVNFVEETQSISVFTTNGDQKGAFLSHFNAFKTAEFMQAVEDAKIAKGSLAIQRKYGWSKANISYQIAQGRVASLLVLTYDQFVGEAISNISLDLFQDIVE